MPSPEYEAFMASITSPLVSADDALEVAREKLEAMHGHPVAPGTKVEWTQYGGVRAAWVTAEPVQDSAGVLLLCHGGAFIAACGDGYLFYAELLSRHTGARVLMVDYRLAPQHLFPAALDDCVAAYRGLLDAGTAARDVVFIGDSCGGGLAIAALVALHDDGVEMPAAAIGLGAWLDLEAGRRSATHPDGADPFADARFTRARGRDYVGVDGDLRHPLVSPVHADLTGLPPLLLQVGQIDLTRDDAQALAASARRVGVDVRLEIWPEMVHGFQGLAAAGIPEGVAALEAVGEYYRARVGPAKEA